MGLLKETRDSSFERLGLLPLSCSAGKVMELLPGKCSLLSDTVLLSPEADTRRELFLHIVSVTDQHCHLICCWNQVTETLCRKLREDVQQKMQTRYQLCQLAAGS